jgi:hypothetical protein
MSVPGGGLCTSTSNVLSNVLLDLHMTCRAGYLTIDCSVAEMMNGPPLPPATMRTAPFSSTIVGDMDDSGRLPGAM